MERWITTKMAKPKSGLTKWFKEGWVDISRKRKGGGHPPCGRKSARGSKAGGYPKCVPASKARRMTDAQKRSAVRRKRKAGNPGGKPRNVATFVKRKRKTTRRKKR
jgi:hypothetical protein